MTQESRWMWCLHCERVWPYVGQLPTRCKTPGCDGNYVDICDYQNHGWHPVPAHWPKVVTAGQLVPLYER